jgi:hypothetical protein
VTVRRAAAFFLAVALFCTAQAHAATTARDLQLMARAVGFVNGLPRGSVDAVIVDGPNAAALHALMGGGVSGGGVTLAPRRVALADLAGSGARVIIVPEGQASAHAAVAQAARQMNAVTVSTDMSCVRAGRCIIGVVAQPRVEIVVSRDAASAANISFGQAFRVMIREL